MLAIHWWMLLIHQLDFRFFPPHEYEGILNKVRILVAISHHG